MRALLSIGCALMLVVLWLGHGTAGSTDAQAVPRLTSLKIDLWPEFDQPAVLVILHAEIAEDVTLPASVSLRIPSSSGGPAAVAYADSADGQLLNLAYQRSDAVDFITLTFSPPEHFFQVEFYDALRTDAAERNYSYVWPGDLPVDHLSVQVQQPAEASQLSVQPELGAGVVKPDGLTYREADLGAFDDGKTLTIDVRYQKTDPRTSAEVLGLATPAPPSDAGGGSEGGTPRWPLLLALLAVLVIGAAVVVIFWRRRNLLPSTSAGRTTRAAQRREQAAGKRESAAGFCPQCGKRLRSDDRFCPGCGAVVRRS